MLRFFLVIQAALFGAELLGPVQTYSRPGDALANTGTPRVALVSIRARP